MQLIARELGHSETAFLLHSDTAMCASATLRQRLKCRFAVTDSSCALCTCEGVRFRKLHDRQTSLAGKHRVTIEKHNDDYVFRWNKVRRALNRRWRVKHVGDYQRASSH